MDYRNEMRRSKMKKKIEKICEFFTQNKIFKNSYFIFFILIPFFKPTYFLQIFWLDKLFDIYRIFSMAIIFCICFSYFKIKNFKSKLLFVLLCYFITSVLITCFRGNSITPLIIRACSVLAFASFVEIEIKYDCKKIFKVLTLIFEILIYINIFTVFVFKDGMYYNEEIKQSRNWFLGYDNVHIVYYMFGIMCSYINYLLEESKNKLRLIVLVVLSIITIVYTWSATSLVALGLMIFGICINKIISKYQKGINVITYFITYVLSFLGIVVFKIQNFFSFFIEKILHKNLTFTGRTYIWDNAKEYIKNHIILGYGNESLETRVAKFNNKFAVNCHNVILEEMYQGGIVLLSCKIMIWYISLKELWKNKEYKISQFFSWFIFVFLIISLMEVYSAFFIYLMYIIAFNIYIIIKEINKRK